MNSAMHLIPAFLACLATFASAAAQAGDLSISGDAVAQAIQASLPEPGSLSFEQVNVTKLTTTSSGLTATITNKSIELRSAQLAHIHVSGSSGGGKHPDASIDVFANDFHAVLDPSTKSGQVNFTLRVTNNTGPLVYTKGFRFPTIKKNRIYAYPNTFDTSFTCSADIRIVGQQIVMTITKFQPNDPNLRIAGNVDLRYGPDPKWVMTVWADKMTFSYGPVSVSRTNPLKEKLMSFVGRRINLGNLPG